MDANALAPLERTIPPHLVPLLEVAADYADAGSAENTRRAYRSDWADFSAWCVEQALCPLPADSGTVALYVAARAGALKVSTLERRLAAIRAKHRELELPAPAGTVLDRVWSGVRHTHGAPPERKRALIVADLRRVVAKIPPGIAGVRDKALLLIAFASAMRRSELVALSLATPAETAAVRCKFVVGGLQISIDRSKGDQEGRGAMIAVPYGKTKLCPVVALRAWLELSGLKKGPVFRGVDRHGRVGDEALSPASIALIVKRAAKRAGLDPDEFAAHSLRAGLVTSAAAAGVTLEVIMRQTRHARTETVLGYIREVEIFKHNAAGKLGL